MRLLATFRQRAGEKLRECDLPRPGRELQFAKACVCVCVLGRCATVTEDAWCAQTIAGSHEVSNRTKQMCLFSYLQEFANVQICWLNRLANFMEDKHERPALSSVYNCLLSAEHHLFATVYSHWSSQRGKAMTSLHLSPQLFCS